MKFVKMHGTGNDFVVIDAITQSVELTQQQIQHLGHRNLGVGFDQLLLIQPPTISEADFTYTIYNHDGSPAEQCGNGSRCVAKFIWDNQLSAKPELLLQTGRHTIRVIKEGNHLIKVCMGCPIIEATHIPLALHNIPQALLNQSLSLYTLDDPSIEQLLRPFIKHQPIQFNALSIGNPHAIFEVNNIDDVPVDIVAPLIQQHPLFPNQVNVGFVQIVDLTCIRLRVYERGAGETMSCGSGACAAVVSMILNHQLACTTEQDYIKVLLRGGELLLHWNGQLNLPITMKGTATTVFEGCIQL